MIFCGNIEQNLLHAYRSEKYFTSFSESEKHILGPT